ncbi:MAG: NAD(P)-binding protein [Actinomycetota bacterium]|nr:NAD(P)-binding protein [Actinomycetota bacterium]
MTNADHIIVGSGLTDAVVARMLCDAGRDVLVVERRDHIGGNVHDSVHHSGIRIHTYGPHYFRTNSAKVWAWATRFAEFYPYEAVLASWVGGRYEHWPVTADYVQRVAGHDWHPAFEGAPTNFEEASLAMMPRRSPPQSTSEIPTAVGFDYLKQRDRFTARRSVVFTGPIDEYFGFDLVRLAYRSQRREHRFEPGVQASQLYGQVNNPDPDNGPHVRTLEWKHMLSRDEAAAVSGTVLTAETPFNPSDPNDYEYPFPDAADKALFVEYEI